MKTYLALLACGCLPLAGLTVWSLFHLGDGHSTATRWAATGDGEKERLQAAKVADQARADKPLVDKLAGENLLGARAGELPAAAPDSSLKKLTETWSELVATQALVKEFVGHYDSMTRLKGAVAAKGKQLDELGESGKELHKLADLHVKRLESEVGVKKEEEAAREWFEKEKYDECLRMVNDILNRYDSLDPKTADGLKKLKKRADYRKDHRVLLDGLSPDPERRLRQYNDFLNRPAGVPPEDLNLDVKVREGQQETEARVALKKFVEELPAKPRDEQLKAASDFLARYDKLAFLRDDLHKEMRRVAQNWLAEYLRGPLAEKPTTDFTGLKDAVKKKDGEVVRGVFAADKGEEYYRYWPTPEKRAEDKLGYTTEYVDSFEKQPADLPELQYTRNFNEQRKKLTDGSLNKQRQSWEDLETNCSRYEKELEEYGKKLRGKKVLASFSGQAKAAHEVLDNWPLLEKLLAP